MSGDRENRVEWAYRTPDGEIHPVSEASANEGYMTAEEYAGRMAESTGGKRVRRRRVTTWTAWRKA